jgi:Notch-like protein
MEFRYDSHFQWNLLGKYMNKSRQIQMWAVRCFDGTYSCTCQEGFTGNDCHIEIPCSNPFICGDGRCINSEDYMSHTCACPRGFTGQLCDLSIPCNGNPCSRHGVCQNLPDFTSYVCICNAGWTGRDCSSSLKAVKRSQSQRRKYTNAGNGRRRFV